MSSPGRGPGGPALGGVPAVSSARDISDTGTARTYAVFLKYPLDTVKWPNLI